MNSLSTPQGIAVAQAKLAELRAILPEHKNLWLLIQSRVSFQDGWESGEDVFTPNKKITGSIRVDQEILKTLKKISVADAKKELARYGVTCFDKLRDVYHNSSHLGHITHDTSLDNDNMDYIYGSLLSYRRYYNPKKTLTDDERKSISQELYLGNYLIVLYDKIRYLYESQRELESTRKSAYHLLDDAGIEDLLQRRWTPSLRYDGDVWDYNSKKDTKDLRDGWEGEAELGHARLLQIDIQNAIHAINIVHDRAIDAFPKVSKDNPEYIKLQEKTRLLLDALKEAMEDIQGPLGCIDNWLGK